MIRKGQVRWVNDYDVNGGRISPGHLGQLDDFVQHPLKVAVRCAIGRRRLRSLTVAGIAGGIK